MTPTDWRALLEAYLSDESDTETFVDEFLEAWQSAKDDKSPIPAVIGDMFYTVKAFGPDKTAGDDAEPDEDELRDEAQRALEQLKANAS